MAYLKLFRLVSGALAVLAGVSPAFADDGPPIELAPEHAAPPVADAPTPPPPAVALGSGPVLDDDIYLHGLSDQRVDAASASASSTSIGGYGEIAVRGTRKGRDGEREWTGDVARLVVFVAHSFSPEISVYNEIEVEHAQACASCGGAVELEQARVDFNLLDEDKLTLRGGLVLVPMGIVNVWHEPPIYHGVVRPRFDTVILPSTWRELALGFESRPLDPVRVEAYVMSGFDPTGFSASGLGGGRQNGSLARLDAPAFVGRVEVEPLLGAVVGVSGYAADAGPNADFYDRRGEPAELRLPVFGYSLDVRFRKMGFDWRFVYADWSLPESGALMAAYDATGSRLFSDATSPVPTRIRGAYVEAAYDVLYPFGLSHQLLPFARIERDDTQAAVPDGFEQNPTQIVREYTFGLTYRPIPQVVLKADLALRNRRLGVDESSIGFGGGFMY